MMACLPPLDRVPDSEGSIYMLHRHWAPLQLYQRLPGLLAYATELSAAPSSGWSDMPPQSLPAQQHSHVTMVCDT